MTAKAGFEALEFEPQLGTTPTAMTVNRFVRANDADITDINLRLRPAFQRNLVWNQEQKAFLLDSILRGIPVPELYIQSVTSEQGDEEIIVVDGQQRISACLEFVEGSLRLGSSEDFDAKWQNRTFDELDDDLKKRVREYEFVVRKLPSNASDSVLREIFRRLNRTVEALLPQELRHAAYTGRFIKLVEEAGSASTLSDLGIFTPADFRRRRNDEFLAEIFFAITADAFPNKKEGLDNLFLAYEMQGFPPAVEENIRARFARVTNWLEPISGDLKRTRFRNKSDAYSLLYYLLQNADHLSDTGTQQSDFLEEAKKYSDLVNGMKRQEAAGLSVDDLVAKEQLGQSALKYLRSVERAASDRLARVRRNEALSEAFKRVVGESEILALDTSEQKWNLVLEDDQEEDSADPLAETHTVQEILLDG
ncbi:MAG: DUF262 domain-containing protein [Candidatus Nanopelagicales bacterium]